MARPRMTPWGFLCWLALISVAAHSLKGAEEPEAKTLPRRDVTLKTADQFALAGTFYPSELGKDAVPVILLHGYRGTRNDLKPLALMLQGQGHAVMTVDLRHHGESSALLPDRGTELRATDMAAMAIADMEAVKSFLMEQNNQGELNIDKLCLVGVEMGASIATIWAARDWSWPMLTTGKQGQDVKALVLVSPEWSFKGLRLNEALSNPDVRSKLSVMIIVGKSNPKSLGEAKRLHAAFERSHPMPPAELAEERQTLWLKLPKTALQGARLVNDKKLHVDQWIARFIELRLVKKPIPWTDRTHPLSGS